MNFKKLIVDSGLKMLNGGYTVETWGNISCRDPETQRVYITPSGMDYGSIAPEDIALCDLATGKWTGPRRPSGERAVHALAYSMFEDVNFVIHTHQTYASALGLAGFDRLPITEAEHAALGGIALAEYALPGTKKLAAHVTDAFLAGARVVLLARHGAVIVGKDADEAFAGHQLLAAIEDVLTGIGAFADHGADHNIE